MREDARGSIDSGVITVHTAIVVFRSMLTVTSEIDDCDRLRIGDDAVHTPSPLPGPWQHYLDVIGYSRGTSTYLSKTARLPYAATVPTSYIESI